MHHKLEQQGDDTYNGGYYIYRHYTRHSTEDWRFIGTVYARSVEDARDRLRRQAQVVLEWED